MIVCGCLFVVCCRGSPWAGATDAEHRVMREVTALKQLANDWGLNRVRSDHGRRTLEFAKGWEDPGAIVAARRIAHQFPVVRVHKLEGIEFDSRHRVVSLNLSSRKISADLSPSLCEFKLLHTLDLSDNLFQRDLPACFANLNQLHTLDLHGNILVGSIPPQWSALTSLRRLTINDNHISGVLTTLTKLTNLRVLHLQRNLLGGGAYNRVERHQSRHFSGERANILAGESYKTT